MNLAKIILLHDNLISNTKITNSLYSAEIIETLGLDIMEGIKNLTECYGTNGLKEPTSEISHTW